MHTSKIIENSQKKWYHFTQFGIFLHYLTSFDVIWHYATLFDMPIISQRSKNVVKRCWVTWRVPLVVYENSGQQITILHAELSNNGNDLCISLSHDNLYVKIPTCIKLFSTVWKSIPKNMKFWSAFSSTTPRKLLIKTTFHMVMF